MSTEDQLPVAIFVFFAVLGVGLLVGENIGWAFAVGLAFTPVLAGIVRWMERQ